MQTIKDKFISIAGVVFFTTMIGLTVFALKEQKDIYESLTRSNNLMIRTAQEQAGLYQNFRALKAKSDAELVQVTQELSQARLILQETQTIMAEIQKSNSLLQEQLALSQQKADQLQASAANPPSQFGSMGTDLQSLNVQKASNLEEGRTLIASLKDKINIVKIRMRELKKEALLARVAAQKEEDRIALEKGNHGFLIKEGQRSTIAEDIQTADKGPKVDINVQFLEQ